MNKVNQLLKHPDYVAHYEAIQTLEADRIYCGHDMEHFLDVARIGTILILEKGLEVDKEVVYAYGLLHDIGRDVEIIKGIEHHLASYEIAKVILQDSDYKEEEIALILGAIVHHRDQEVADLESFNGLMYRADKASRACHSCKVRSTCNWDDHKKNWKVEG